ncbi:hypothetical protein P4S64_12235 [Vibrio sp. M60_M31a]
MQPVTSGNIRYVDESSDVELELADYKRVKRDPLFADLRLIFQDSMVLFKSTYDGCGIIEEPLKLLRTEMSAQERKDRVRNMMRRVGLPAEFSPLSTRILWRAAPANCYCSRAGDDP